MPEPEHGIDSGASGAPILTRRRDLVVHAERRLGHSLHRRPGSRHRDRRVRLGARHSPVPDAWTCSWAWDIRPAAAGDDLSRALDYAAVSARVQAFAAAEHFQLVETFAERLATLLMAELRHPLAAPAASPSPARCRRRAAASAWRSSADVADHGVPGSGAAMSAATGI